jgi:peptidoglycan hydrolase-like protein with peptidoglycan-binding domain
MCTLACLVAPAAAAAASAEVAALQIALRAKGLYSGPIDGIPGPGTASGVRAAQSRAGIAVDGVSGPMTRRALGRLGRPPFGSRILRAPAVGWDASILQFSLAGHGFPSGPFDGALGPRTTAALIRFQGARGLSADGIAGPATFAAVRAPAQRFPIALRRPVNAPISDGFGPRGGKFHTGVDFPAPSGAPVFAAAAGCVRFVGDAGDGFGTVVTISHGNELTTLYAHLSSAAVSRGACVGAGAVIGRVGSTGFSTGPHLHFETRIRGAAVRPPL